MTEGTDDTIGAFRLNQGALRYFGIICFYDIPGYYPQLGKTDEQNKNLVGHVSAVAGVRISTPPRG